MTTGVKLLIGAAVVAGATGYMAYVGASASWQYYLTADECVGNATDLAGSRIRVNGKVAPGSLQIAADRSQATFVLGGASRTLAVSCPGPLPDNLKEDMDVVVEGRLDQAGRLHGEKVLTRCASKYKSNKSPSGEGADRRRAEEGS
jgi:cytochrome c-type biogenesis protein CcmE